MSRQATSTGPHIPCSDQVRRICPDRKCWLNCRHTNPAQREESENLAGKQRNNGDRPAHKFVIG
jgi:hypothetical protein